MQMALGLRTCSRHDERRFALRLLNAVLGENMSSRLFQVLREDRGLAYSVHSSLSFFDDTGALEIYVGLDSDRLPQVLKLIARELRRLAEKPPSAGEVRRARDYLVGQFDLSLEGTENMMMWVGEQFLAYGKITRPAEVKRCLRAVTPGQIHGVARQFLHSDRVSLAVVGRLKSRRGLIECLRL
jgi:predicted Zn-dependent peptidase